MPEFDGMSSEEVQQACGNYDIPYICDHYKTCGLSDLLWYTSYLRTGILGLNCVVKDYRHILKDHDLLEIKPSAVSREY